MIERDIPAILKKVGVMSLRELTHIFREDWRKFVDLYPDDAAELISELVTERIQDDDYDEAYEIEKTSNKTSVQTSVG